MELRYLSSRISLICATALPSDIHVMGVSGNFNPWWLKPLVVKDLKSREDPTLSNSRLGFKSPLIGIVCTFAILLNFGGKIVYPLDVNKN